MKIEDIISEGLYNTMQSKLGHFTIMNSIHSKDSAPLVTQFIQEDIKKKYHVDISSFPHQEMLTQFFQYHITAQKSYSNLDEYLVKEQRKLTWNSNQKHGFYTDAIGKMKEYNQILSVCQINERDFSQLWGYTITYMINSQLISVSNITSMIDQYGYDGTFGSEQMKDIATLILENRSLKLQLQESKQKK